MDATPNATSFHADDIVAKKSSRKALAVVERTAADIDTHVPFPGQTEDEPINHDRSISRAAFRQFMKDGIPPKDTILVRWRDEAVLELLPTSVVTLVDRSLLIGDIVKRRPNDAMSGCVLNTITKCTLQPMCDVTYQNTQTFKGILPPGRFEPPNSQFCIYPDGKTAELTDIPASELMYADALFPDDLVIFRDWIGRVAAITYAIQIRLSDNCVVEISEDEAEHVDGAAGSFSTGDLARTKKGTLRMGGWIFGRYNANTSPVGTVVNLRMITAGVDWLEKRIGSTADHEPPPALEAQELDSAGFRVYDRSRRPKSLNASEQPSLSNSEPEIRLNARVRFKDLTGACLKYGSSESPVPRLDRNNNLGYDLNVFDVLTMQTSVTVQWQDLSITTEKSIDLLPDECNDDEHAAWPGEIAHTLKLREVPGMENVVQPDRIGVIQSVNSEDRMTQIKWLPDSYIRYAKDPDNEVQWTGVVEHRISTMSAVEEEVSLYDIEAPAAINVRRGDIVFIANTNYNCAKDDPSDMTWLGEIVDTRLDGTFVVRLGAALDVEDVVLHREETIVAIRSDGTGHSDWWENDEFDEDDEYDEDEDSDFDPDDTDALTSDLEEAAAHYEDENGMQLDEADVENDEWESADEENIEDDDDAEMHDAPEHQTSLTTDNESIAPNEVPAAPATNSEGVPPRAIPKAYDVLEGEPPSEHKFANEPPTTTPQHVKRTHMEHKILRNPSTLPEGVYIRTWESRLDLLRVLLIGPSETPYAHAPFVIDIYLAPEFPLSPPRLHFHSWNAIASIGSLGRVNPNLYEDGKICLSLLGTWEGGKGESWNASRCTLLQVIVSLLGLVLVREPYYNEAGYETLVGTEGSKRQSALYSERVFLRAKGFLITALSSKSTAPGLPALEDVVEWLYYRSDGPTLLQVMTQEVEEVLKKSNGGGESDGLTIMSKGAAISAQRLLERLKGLAKA